MSSPGGGPTVSIGGDASGAVGAVAAAQAAIDSLTGKTVNVDINFSGGGADPSGFATAAGRAADSAGDAFRGFSDRVNQASDDMGGLRDHARATADDFDRISSGRAIVNNSDVSNARAVRGELERISDSDALTGSGSGLRQLESSAGSMRALTTGAGDAGREMRALESGSSRAAIELRQVDGVFQAVGSGGSLASRVISAFGRSMDDSGSSGGGLADVLDDVPGKLGNLAGMAGTAGRALGMVGLAGLYSAAGSGIAAAAVGGMGFAAAIADIASSGPTLSKAKNLVSDFGQEFRKVAPETTKLAMPGLENMSSQVKAIGSAVAQMGLSHMPEMMAATSTALAQVLPTMRALEPAISPAVNAAEALVRQAPRIAEAATPALNQFSNTVANSAQGLGDLAVVGVKTAGALGSAAVSVASTWGERMESLDQTFPKAIPGTADLAAGLFGGKSNQLDPSSLSTSGASQAGNILGGFGAGAGLGAVLGGIIGSIIPGAGTLAGAGLGAAIGGGAGGVGGAALAFGDTRLPQLDAALAAGQKAGAVYGPNSPVAGSVAPLYPTAEERQQQEQQAKPPPPPPPVSSASTQQLDGRQLASLPRSVGESGPGLSGTASQLATLNQEMAKTTNMSPLLSQSMQNVGSSAQQSMQQAGGAAQQAAPQFQQGLGQMAQHAAQLPPQIGSTMSMLAPAVAQPMAQVAPAAAAAIQPQPIADAAGAAVTKAVKQVQPQAESGGEDMGASVPTGAAAGVTQNVDKVITVIEHLIKKVIQVGAEGLDSHSPSRVFAALGASIPQGLAVGMDSSSSLAVAASENLINKVTQGAASQLGGNQPPLQNQASQQAQAQAQQQAAQQQALQKQQEMGAAFPLQQQGQAQAAKAAADQAEEIRRAAQTGDDSRLSPQARQQFEQAKQQANLFQYQDGRMFDANRHNTLTDKLGYSDATAERVQDREQRHNQTADEHKDERRKNHVDAMMRAGSDASVKTKLEHEFGEHGKAVGNGTADGIKASSGQTKSGVADMVNGMIDESKKRLGISSPSKVFAGIGGDTGAGLAGGLSGAVSAASTAAMGVASDSGLQLGYRWGTSMVTGLQSVFKSSDFQASAVPQITNDVAKAALGAANLLGAAGAGAMIYKNPMVSMPGGSSSGALTNQLHLTVNLDGQPFREMSAQIAGGQIDQFINDLNNSHSTQVG